MILMAKHIRPSGSDSKNGPNIDIANSWAGYWNN